MTYNLIDLEKIIEKIKTSDVELQQIIVGYKTYSKLTKYRKFTERITICRKNPLVRYYKGVKIERIVEKYFLNAV